MATLFVARSAALCQWASDVGLGKNIFKVGICDGDPGPVVAAGFAGESDWKLVAQRDTALEAEAVADNIATRLKPVDPTYYPRIKGEPGIVKLVDSDVQRHIILARALEGESEKAPIRLKPADYAAYLLAAVTR